MPAVARQNSANFQRFLDIFTWKYQLGWGNSNEAFGYVVGVDMTSSMQDNLRSRKWKDDQLAFISLRRMLRKDLHLLTRLQQSLFHDELSTLNYDRTAYGVTVANAWQPREGLLIQPELGYRWEKRAELLESGPYFALAGSVPEFELAGYQNASTVFGEITRFDDRENSNARITYSVSREFQPGTVDSLAVNLDYLRRDNYFSAPQLGRIESLRKLRRNVANYLHYEIGPRTTIAMRTTFSLDNVTVQRLGRTAIEARRDHDDFVIGNVLELRWAAGRLAGAHEFETGQSIINYSIPDSVAFSPFSRNFASLGYDIDDRAARLTNRVSAAISRRDSLHLRFSLAKLQHENSDAQNPDDYDEQRWQFSLQHRRNLANGLSFSWELSGFLKHFLYVDAALSSQNNWTRLLQLQPAIRYQPLPRLSFQQRAGIRTQYVVYDFATSQPVNSSYVIRNLFIADSIDVPLSARVQINLNYRYEIEELGTLNWGAFQSRPRTMWRSHWGSIVFRQTWEFPLQLRAGANFYRQTRWQYLPGAGGVAWAREGAQANIGPVVQILYQAPGGSVIHFSGERQRVFPIAGRAYYINNFQLTVQWTF